MRKLTILLVLLLLGGMQVVLAQKTITGMITSKEDGSGIPGASVVITGTTVGTITDITGKFALSVPANAVSLHITYIGMKPMDVEIGTSKEILVSLESEAVALDEVVVVGYGTLKKRDLTGAISSVRSGDIILASSSDIGHAIKGKAAGLMIRENSAQPGGGLDIFIRGAASINASNAPLIVVDGFPITDLQQPESGDRYRPGTQSVLNSFNPNDIESIEVLKDASATAIYGSRAAHGVILITTKRGKEGKPVVQYSASFAFQNFKNPFNLLPLNEWMQVRNESKWEDWLFTNQMIPWGTNEVSTVGFQKDYTQEDINNAGSGTDWVGLVTRNGSTKEHNISVSGGTKSTKYFISGNYYDQQGIIKNSEFERYTVRGNFDQIINKYFKLGFNFSESRVNNGNTTLGQDLYENSGVIRAAIQQGPQILAIDADGNYPLNPQSATQPNPLSMLNIIDKGTIDRTMVDPSLDITPVKDLVIKLKAGIDRGLTHRGMYQPRTTLHGAPNNGIASIMESDENHYLLEGTVNYNAKIGTEHSFYMLAGVSEEKFIDVNNSEGNTGFITDAFLWNNLSAGSGTKTMSSSSQENLIASYFGRLNYIFNEKYYATFTIRTDGSSVFAKNNKWATFHSVALGWNVSAEPFFANMKSTVSQLKVRLSYGKTGNASLQKVMVSYGQYGEIGSTTLGNNAFSAYNSYLAYLSGDDVKNIGVSLSRLANPDLKWETTTEANFGIDYSIFKDRISGSFELYGRVISDLLAMKSINSYQAINQIIANVGKTQSRGFEFSISTRNIQKEDFQWKSMLVSSRFKDKWLERAPDWKPAVYESTNDPVRAIYSKVSDGIMQIGEVVPAQPYLLPGMIKIKDINGYQRDENGNPVVDKNGRFLRTGKPDGIIDDADTKLIGTSDPSLILGFTNMFTYKGFTLNFDFNGMFGRKLEDPNYVFNGVSAEEVYVSGQNAQRTVLDRWTPDNPSTTHPSSYYGWSQDGAGDFFLQDAWFVRLQNVSIGYNLPERWIKGIFKEANLHIDAQNLFVITPYTGIDPETDSYAAAYPNVKTFTMGLNIIF